MLVWASSGGSGETARMRRLAWTFAARIGDKYQIRLTRSIYVDLELAERRWQFIPDLVLCSQKYVCIRLTYRSRYAHTNSGQFDAVASSVLYNMFCLNITECIRIEEK